MNRFLLLLLIVFAVGFSASSSVQAQDFDYLILGCRIIDGSGNPWYRGDVGIRDGRIAEIGRLEGRGSSRVIEAADRVLAPGFIDVHTHVERGIERVPRADNYLLDGVTTVVTGNCGGSRTDLNAWFQSLESQGIGLNLASLIGHNSVRREVMGSADRPASPNELRAMRELVERAMRAGAVGLSTGLLYVPGTYAETDEIVDLTRVAGRFGGVYASHIRNQGPRLRESILEAAEVGRLAGVPVQISHLKVKGKKRWGTIVETLTLIDGLRDSGLQIIVDAYPYPRASTNLGVNLPSWALADGRDAVQSRLSDPDQRQRIVQGMKELLAEQGFSDYSFATVARFAHDPSLEGRSLTEVNTLRGRNETLDDQIETILEMLAQGGASMIYHYMSQEDVDSIYRHPATAVASDGGVQSPGRGRPHPRSYGTNARVLAQYVRQRSVLSLEDAVRRMTSLPASQFGLSDRGEIREGMVADLLLFDPEKVEDVATFEDPHRYSRGIDFVWVNGRPAISEGRLSDETHGVVIRRGR